jgi:hypothetical protein
MEEHQDKKIRVWYNFILYYQGIDQECFPNRVNRAYPPLHAPDDIPAIAEAISLNQSFGEPPLRLRRKANYKITLMTRKTVDQVTLLDLMSCSGQPMNSLSLSLPQSIYHFVNA